MSSIHILNNQRVRVGISVNPDPARRTANLQLDGGSTYFALFLCSLALALGWQLLWCWGSLGRAALVLVLLILRRCLGLLLPTLGRRCSRHRRSRLILRFGGTPFVVRVARVREVDGVRQNAPLEGKALRKMYHASDLVVF